MFGELQEGENIKKFFFQKSKNMVFKEWCQGCPLTIVCFMQASTHIQITTKTSNFFWCYSYYYLFSCFVGLWGHLWPDWLLFCPPIFPEVTGFHYVPLLRSNYLDSLEMGTNLMRSQIKTDSIQSHHSHKVISQHPSISSFHY